MSAKLRVRSVGCWLGFVLLQACAGEPRSSTAPQPGGTVSAPAATLSAVRAQVPSATARPPATSATVPPAEAHGSEPGPPRIGVNGEPGDPSSSEKVMAVVRAAGGDPVPLAFEADLELGSIDGVVLTGGKDIDPKRYGEKRHPKTSLVSAARDAFDFRLVARSEQLSLPTLAICLGAQELWVARGGSLLQDIPTERPSTVNHRALAAGHPVLLESASRLRAIYGKDQLQVFSNHHQAPDGKARGFVVAALSPDGLIEAFEGETPERFVIGVGWHPERTPAELVLFEALVEAAVKRRKAFPAPGTANGR